MDQDIPTSRGVFKKKTGSSALNGGSKGASAIHDAAFSTVLE
jgi:hypothetical protein